jgi:hypothetical protein
VLSTIDWPIAIVPFEKLSNSNTPIGPFHNIVFALLITFEKSLIDFGPASNPCQSFGMLLIL